MGKCKFCGKELKHKGSMKLHQKRHTAQMFSKIWKFRDSGTNVA